MKVYCNECMETFEMNEGRIVLRKCDCGYDSDVYEPAFYCEDCYSIIEEDIVDVFVDYE